MAKENTSRIMYTFFGPPGSGKGTLAHHAHRTHGCKVLSTGNLLRKLSKQGGEFAEKIDSYLSEGRLIPNDLMSQLVTDWLEKHVEDGEPIIFDGYPRTQEQAESFVTLLKKRFPDFCFRVISFSIEDEEVIRRLGGRLVCSNAACQSVYSVTVSPEQGGICDCCGSKLMKRNDDGSEIVLKRLRLYDSYRDRLLPYYESQGVPIERIEVTQLSPEEVFATFDKLYSEHSSSSKNSSSNQTGTFTL